MKIKLKFIGAITLPLFYVILTLATQDPDRLIFILGPFGFAVWIVQWIAFVVGGWILTIIATILFLALVGFILGGITGWILKKFKK